MFKWFKHFLGVFILIGILSYSCNYRYRALRDKDGKRHYLREYNTIENEEKHYCKMKFRHRYPLQKFVVDSTCISRADSTVECDSIKIRILSDSKEYAKVFTKGLISCKMINDVLPDNRLRIIDVQTNKEVIPEIQRIAYIHSVSALKFIKTSKNRRLFKFRITAYTFYFELTNDKANKKTNMNEFINGATLTWFYKSGTAEI